MKLIRLLYPTLALTLLLATGCTEYWWTRGQPPGNETLLKRSEERLSASIESHKLNRQQVTDLTVKINEAVNDSLVYLTKTSGYANPGFSQAIDRIQSNFINLEEHLSAGSRPAYGELSSQLLAFSNDVKGKEFSGDGYRLFAARTKFFLARELEVKKSYL